MSRSRSAHKEPDSMDYKDKVFLYHRRIYFFLFLCVCVCLTKVICNVSSWSLARESLVSVALLCDHKTEACLSVANESQGKYNKWTWHKLREGRVDYFLYIKYILQERKWSIKLSRDTHTHSICTKRQRKKNLWCNGNKWMYVKIHEEIDVHNSFTLGIRWVHVNREESSCECHTNGCETQKEGERKKKTQ